MISNIVALYHKTYDISYVNNNNGLVHDIITCHIVSKLREKGSLIYGLDRLDSDSRTQKLDSRATDIILPRQLSNFGWQSAMVQCSVWAPSIQDPEEHLHGPSKLCHKA